MLTAICKVARFQFLTYGFFDVEKGAWFLVFDAPFSMLKTSFGLAVEKKSVFSFWLMTCRLDRPECNKIEKKTIKIKKYIYEKEKTPRKFKI